MKKKNPYRFLVWGLFLIIILIGFGGYWYWNGLQSPVNKNDTSVEAFVVTPGESIGEVASRLEEEGFIKSALAFKLAARNKPDFQVEAGDYKLSPSFSLAQIMSTLSEGSIDKWVTLLEGWRAEEIANELNSVLGIDKTEFLQAAKEGYMFPDTYLFNPDTTAEDIATTLETTFNKKYDNQLQQKIRALGLTPDQGVILASLVEREARSDKVRTEVASIMLKRLKMGMKLDIDATVQYAKDSQLLKNGQLKKFWQPITQEEYQSVVSPYNTYLNAGLPPEPIANPSLSSLNAVANANPNTPYLYYYHDAAGNTYYARTLEEHNANVANH